MDGGARRGHEKKREGDMRRDENTPAMLSRSSDHASLPARERARRIVARETQCGGETEEDPAKQRERDGKREDGSVYADDGFGWKGVRGQHQRKPGKPVRPSHAQDGARAGDDQRFDEQLAHDAPAAGADRTANGELMLARAATGQQQDGAIGAADD